jgi:hypothetical protein
MIGAHQFATKIRTAKAASATPSATPGLDDRVEVTEPGMLVSPCLSAPSTVLLLRPMVTTDEQLDQAVDFALLNLGKSVPRRLLGGT